jgi:hypothetical protein
LIQWLTIIGLVLAVLTGLGSAALFITIGRWRGRVESLEGQNTDLRNDLTDSDRRAEIREKDIVLQKKEIERQASEIVLLHAQIATLTEAVSGEAHYTALHELIEEFHTGVMGVLPGLVRGQADILNLLGDKRGKVDT